MFFETEKNMVKKGKNAVNPVPNKLWFLCVCSTSLFKNTGKRRNCSYQAVSPLTTVFSICMENFLPFSSNLKLLSANSFSLEESIICCLGKGYTVFAAFPQVFSKAVFVLLIGKKIFFFFWQGVKM